MNKERLLQLADVVEASKTFDMSNITHWGVTHPCGTPACILGHAEFMRTGKPRDIYNNAYSWETSLEWLGLTRDQGDELFGPDNKTQAVHYTDDISPAQAAATTRRLVETGEVKW